MRNSIKSSTLTSTKRELDIKKVVESPIPIPREPLSFNTYFNIDPEYINLLKEQCKP